MLESFSKFGAKIGSQRHMVTIRDSFAANMPLILAGAFATLMNNVFFVPWSLLERILRSVQNLAEGEVSAFTTWTNEHIAPFFVTVDAGTFAILSLTLVFALGYNLAKSYDEDPLSAGLIAVGAFFTLSPLVRISGTAGWIANYLGAQGIFVALFTGLIATEIFVKITKRGLVIKMPEMVPPAVGRAFAAIIPGIIAILSFSLINYIFANAPILAGEAIQLGEELVQTPNTIFNWIEQNISNVLVNLLSSENSSAFIGASIASVISLFIGLFWTVGLHGANLLAPVTDGIYLPLAVENASNFANGLEASYVWVRASWDAYVFLGGSGTTIALIAAIFVVGKRKEEREIAKFGLLSGTFQINEPVIFGLPVVLNPIYAIPFIISQPILTFIAYMATYIGLVDPLVNIIPWTTPPVIGALMASNFDIFAGLLAIFNLFIAFLIYVPFVIASNKVAEKEG